jgi:hypothetical protein
MTKPHGEQRHSTNRYPFIEDTFTEKPQTDKTRCWQNRTISETVFQNSKSGEKAPGLSNELRIDAAESEKVNQKETVPPHQSELN